MSEFSELSFDGAGKATAIVVLSYWPWRLCSLRWEALVLIRPAQRLLAGCVRESLTEALLENLLKFTLFCTVFSVSAIQNSVAPKSSFFSQSVTSPLPSHLASLSRGPLKKRVEVPARRSMILVSVTFAWSSDDCVSIV